MIEWIKDTVLFTTILIEVLWYWREVRSDWYSKGRVAKRKGDGLQPR